MLRIVPTDRVAGGWEQCAAAPMHAKIDRTLEDFFRRHPEPVQRPRPVELGRFDIVCVSSVVRQLLAYTVTSAFELDRVLGYEANAGGMSWISDPLTAMGTQIGSPLVTITGNRSAPGQLATVQWDDEGVAPDEVTVVKQGTLNDFWTTREMAGWLEPAYQKRGLPVRSHGCAASGSALDFPLVHPPNVELRPGSEAVRFEDLVTSTTRGIAILGGSAVTDPQGSSGAFDARNFGAVNAREIVNGRLGKPIDNVGFLFQASELWKNVSAVGGTASVESGGMMSTKGEPGQTAMFTVSAVPMKVSSVPIVNMERL
jgi:TldD protein